MTREPSPESETESGAEPESESNANVSGASYGTRHDLKTAALATLLGISTLAIADYLATLIVSPGPLRISTALRLLLLEFTLASFLLLLVLPFTLLAAVLARVALRLWRPKIASQWPGLFGPTADHKAPSKVAIWMWAAAVGSLVFLACSTLLTLKLSRMFKEPQLTAFMLSIAQLVVVIFCLAVAALVAKLAARFAHRLHSRLGLYNPLGSAPAAAVAIILLTWPLLRVVLRVLPQLGPLIEWRHILSLIAFSFGAYVCTQVLAKRGRLFPAKGPKRVKVTAGLSLLLVVVVPLTLFRVGADPDTKALAISSSPTMSKTMNLLRKATDFDKDGFGSLLGENDCGPFNNKVHPLARDIPDNGIDENCDGRDFKLGTLPSYKSGKTMPVPEAFQGDWNFLLLTIDTVRYDHTSFGGYKRDTTPELVKFVNRSANFTFANAPSAGTMGSIPAIITSKFFHSGIALEEDVPRGSPPILKDENTLLSELFKRKGYRTGAILSHEYFNNWGMDQGVDDYDNTVGKKRNPSAVTSQILTDRSIAWIGKQKKKWFLWTHFIDPHGYYVSHPGEVSYGDSEMDLYDGELHFTDKHVARLLDYIARSPIGNKTVIAITSDHGDAFGEHGYINHAQDLHKEILHVPLIFYVPNIEPRHIDGAVSPIDIFPTFAAMIGSDISELNVEGVSLVPQLFYGQDAHERIVFAETNYPKPLRAVVNSRYKLILDLKNNVSRLWDLKKDPLEKKNIWTKDKVGYAEMRGYLNEWIERVVYARDAASNQAINKLKDHLVGKRPAEAIEVKGVSLEGDTIIVDSYERKEEELSPGDIVNLSLYFRSEKKIDRDLKFQVEVWIDGGPKGSKSARSRVKLTGGGMFPSSRWHPGELVRDRFKITLPSQWNSEKDGQKVTIGLRIRASGKEKPTWKGPLKEGTTDLLVIGDFKLSVKTPAPTPKTPVPGAVAPGKKEAGKELKSPAKDLKGPTKDLKGTESKLDPTKVLRRRGQPVQPMLKSLVRPDKEDKPSAKR